MFRVTAASNVDSIPQQGQWNQLARGRDFALTTPMLSMTEKARPKPSQFFMAWDESENAVGAVPVYLIGESTTVSAYHRIDLIIKRIMGTASWELTNLGVNELLPAVFIGPHQISSARMLLDQTTSPETQRAVATTLLEQVEEQARTWGAQTVYCPYVAKDDHTLRETFAERGYLSFPSAWFAVLEIRWSDFEEYLQSFASARRKKIQNERRRVTEAGINMEVVPLTSDLVPRLDWLKGNHDVKYHGESARQMPSASSYLAVAAKSPPGEPLVVLARMDGDIIGFSFAYRYRDELYAEQLGFDYERIKGVPLYFELVYYQLIEYSIRYGIRRVNYGPEAFQAKIFRGCYIEQQTAFVRCFDSKIHNRLLEAVASLDEQKLYQEVLLR